MHLVYVSLVLGLLLFWHVWQYIYLYVELLNIDHNIHLGSFHLGLAFYVKYAEQINSDNKLPPTEIASSIMNIY